MAVRGISAKSVLALVVWAAIVVPAPVTASSGGVEQFPVSFHVQNVNRSKAQDPSCVPDEKWYEVAGTLVAPAGALDGSPGLTVYLHSVSVAGQTLWRMPVPGYDWAAEMALLGEASLVIDMLGWGASDHPPGTQVCLGAEADILHQIVGKLEDGSGYTIDGRAPERFGKVAVATWSGAAIVSQIEAYTWGDTEGLIEIGWSDPPTGLGFTGAVPRIVTECATGGENRNDDGTGPPGYFFVWPSPDAEARDVTYNIDPVVLAEMKRNMNRDPCGITSGGRGMLADLEHVATIESPVLLVYADHDAMVRHEASVTQRALYRDNPDVTTIVMANTGHAMMLERTAPLLRGFVDQWLDQRGF